MPPCQLIGSHNALRRPEPRLTLLVPYRTLDRPQTATEPSTVPLLDSLRTVNQRRSSNFPLVGVNTRFLHPWPQRADVSDGVM